MVASPGSAAGLLAARQLVTGRRSRRPRRSCRWPAAGRCRRPPSGRRRGCRHRPARAAPPCRRSRASAAYRRRPGRHAGPRAASRLRPAASSDSVAQEMMSASPTACRRSATARTVIGRPSACGSDAESSRARRLACSGRRPQIATSSIGRTLACTRMSWGASAPVPIISSRVAHRAATGSARPAPRRRRCAAWSASCRRAAPRSGRCGRRAAGTGRDRGQRRACRCRERP